MRYRPRFLCRESSVALFQVCREPNSDPKIFSLFCALLFRGLRSCPQPTVSMSIHRSTFVVTPHLFAASASSRTCFQAAPGGLYHDLPCRVHRASADLKWDVG